MGERRERDDDGEAGGGGVRGLGKRREGDDNSKVSGGGMVATTGVGVTDMGEVKVERGGKER